MARLSIGVQLRLASHRDSESDPTRIGPMEWSFNAGA